MIASIVQIGNSRGIRLPKNILRELNFKDEVEMTIHNNALLIKSIQKKPRNGWHEAFAKMANDKADKLLINENIDCDDFEWVW